VDPVSKCDGQAFQRVVSGADPTAGERYDHLTLDERKLGRGAARSEDAIKPGAP